VKLFIIRNYILYMSIKSTIKRSCVLCSYIHTYVGGLLAIIHVHVCMTTCCCGNWC